MCVVLSVSFLEIRTNMPRYIKRRDYGENTKKLCINMMGGAVKKTGLCVKYLSAQLTVSCSTKSTKK